MTDHHLDQTDFKAQIFEVALRIIAGTLTVGLLIVLPALKILGLA